MREGLLRVHPKLISYSLLAAQGVVGSMGVFAHVHIGSMIGLSGISTKKPRGPESGRGSVGKLGVGDFRGVDDQDTFYIYIWNCQRITKNKNLKKLHTPQR